MPDLNPAPLPEASPRRQFLRWLTGSFLSLWGLGFAWVVGAFVKPTQSRDSLGARLVKVGSLESFEVGEARFVRHGKEPFFVIRTGEDTLVALAGVCTHMHCVLDWSAEKDALVCPCHRGSFDINGSVIGGPPVEPLGRLRVETQLGQVYVHLRAV
jgi:cytochrome b6-f complex iron-sulfur subunit